MRLLAAVPSLLLTFIAACAAQEAREPSWVDDAPVRGPVRPIARVARTTREQDLGARLFSEPRLSRSGQMSCATCHPLDGVGTDNATRRVGDDPNAGVVSTPTIYNVGLNAKHFWDGRAATLEAQVDGPLTSPLEMDMTWDAVVAMLQDDDGYREAFRDVYGRGPDAPGVRAAIAAFERTLNTPDAPFDRWLRGDADAISREAAEGFTLFVEYGCASCHQGANVGGNMFQVFGAVLPRFTAETPPTDYDLGILRRTGREQDRHRFRVPGLRLVAYTAPYMHDGSVPTLDEAILTMGRLQLGVEIPPTDRALVAAFLAALSPPVSP
jgi:cytochrome c peroxidase